jgi:hypothetical protein
MIKVDGYSNLYRDEESGAIINSDSVEYSNRLRRISSIKNEKNELKRMKSEIDELKALLKKVLEKSTD